MGDSLAGRRAWVVGGGSGIGRATALALAAERASVVISGRREDALRSTQERGGDRIELLPLDVSRPNDFERAQAVLGPVDILVYSAGTNIPRRSLAELSDKDWSAVLDVNLAGAMRAVQTVLPGMRERRSGTILVVSSWAGWRLEPIAGAAYTTTKHALLSLTEVINVEEGRNGVRATCLCPAEIDTDVLNTRPSLPSAEARALMLKPDDVARLIVFIACAPPHMCVNQIVLSPTANSFYRRP